MHLITDEDRLKAIIKRLKVSGVDDTDNSAYISLDETYVQFIDEIPVLSMIDYLVMQDYHNSNASEAFEGTNQ